MNDKDLLSDDMSVVAKALKKAIALDKSSTVKQRAHEGVRYYNYDHDILKNRIFYVDKNGRLQEDKFASNIKIPHTFFTELVDQKVQYLLSNPVKIVTENQELEEYLKEYYDDEMQLFLQEVTEGFSQKGVEFAYARTTAEDRLSFQVADSLKTFEVKNELGETKRIVRYYTRPIQVNKETKQVDHAELWDDKEIHYFVVDSNGNYKLDKNNHKINPRPHVLAQDEKGNLAKRSYDFLPFFRVENNKNRRTDLEPIKALIDDYDLMAAFLSNNLQDFAEAIYVVKGFKGDNLEELRQNVKAKKTIGVGTDGGLDIKTVEIPVEARETKLAIDKEGIYKFGMGFDSSQISDSRGQVTNVAIQSGYSLLNMKANKAEIRLRTLIAWMNELIIEDINRRYSKSFTADEIEEVIMERETMTDMKENAEIKEIEANTRMQVIETILAVAPRIDDENVLKLICEQFDLDLEEVEAELATQGYTSGLQDDTDPIEEGVADESTE